MHPIATFALDFKFFKGKTIFIANPIWPPNHATELKIFFKVTSTLTYDDTDEIAGESVYYF